MFSAVAEPEWKIKDNHAEIPCVGPGLVLQLCQLHENRGFDREFWKRVIPGDCQLGDTARALHSFEKINRSGGKTTFSTLYDLLLVLSRSGEADATDKVIEVSYFHSHSTRDGSSGHVNHRSMSSPRTSAPRARPWHS